MKFTQLSAAALTVVSLCAGVSARSTVYQIPDPKEQNKPVLDVSLASFSAFLSYMTGTTAAHPALQWQHNAMDGADALWNEQRPERVGGVFERPWRSSLVIVLAGAQSPSTIMPNHGPTFYVSDNDPTGYVDMAFHAIEHVQTIDHGLVATFIDDEISVSYQGTSLSYSYSQDPYVINTFKSHYSDKRLDFFDFDQVADRAFAIDVEALRALVNDMSPMAVDDPESVSLGVARLTSLQKLANAYGVASAQYQEAQLILRDLLAKSVIPGFQDIFGKDDRTTVMVVTTPPFVQSKSKRDIKVEGTTCHTTLDMCNSATSSCSNRGECVAVNGCYVCQCKAANSVGDACQYVDVVSSFHVLFWTGLGLLLTTSGIIVFMVKTAGSDHGSILMTPQSLPKRD